MSTQDRIQLPSVCDGKGTLPLQMVRVYGMSMYPALLSGERVLILQAACQDLQPGDIVISQRPGALERVAHRVVRVEWACEGTQVITRGDACGDTDAPLRAEDILGRAIGVWRNGQMAWLQR